MKKFSVVLVAVSMAMALSACGKSADENVAASSDVVATQESSSEVASSEATSAEASAEADVKSEGVMTYEEYAAAALDTEVVVETYVQAKQSWWEDKATIYTQDQDGAYFIYEMACSQEDYEKLTVGTKIKVTGYKAEWAGEVRLLMQPLKSLRATMLLRLRM